METILVTGGAGYVGSHIALALSRAGKKVVVFDNLANGHASFVKWGPLEHGDIRDRARLDAVIAHHKPAAVVHCAALIEVGESVKDPGAFYENNVSGTINLLRAMHDGGVKHFVLSSTCAVYGAPKWLPLDESHPVAPLNPYGWTKLMAEQVSRDMAQLHGGSFAHLRYFNAAGAAAEFGIGERHEPETHAIPLALFALMGRRAGFKIFGEDYDTPDGSCVRDYVHVRDLADAHVRAVDRLIEGGESLVLNLGGGAGVSVKQLIAAVERVVGRKLNAALAPRRPGDSPALVADARAARHELGWTATRDIDEIIASAWRWHTEIEPGAFPDMAKAI